MLPHIEGVKECPCCHKQLIPKDTKPIYIPDKRNYTNRSRKYCYVMDAIAQEMRIHSELSCIDEAECRTVIRELKNNKWIVLKEGCVEDSLDYNDYLPSLSLDWHHQKSSQKTELVINALKATAELIKLANTAIVFANS